MIPNCNECQTTSLPSFGIVGRNTLLARLNLIGYVWQRKFDTEKDTTMSWETYKMQAALFFALAKMAGHSREDAVNAFICGELCKLGGDELTVGIVYGFAEAGGYSA